MKKLLLAAIFMICIVAIGNAQNYKTGIGARGGVSNGLTIKHFFGQKAAGELILSSRWKGFNITGLYEVHHQAFDINSLKWYYGLGGHVGFWNGKNVNWVKDNYDYTVTGINGVLGLEFSFKEIPVNISIDWLPTLNLSGYKGFWGDGGAVSIRYIF